MEVKLERRAKEAKMGGESDFGAFVEKFKDPSSIISTEEVPLKGLTFAVKDIFDMEGYVTGFGNPDWSRTHSAATSTAPAVLDLLKAGAVCVGRTVLDEMAFSINGENKHYGTPVNPSAADRVPGGSSSGSAVAVGANLVDFSIGTDTGGSVRVPAAFCGILGFRPSHGVVSTDGVIPMAQSFDTVGWFARDPDILHRVGQILLKSPPDSVPDIPNQVIIAEDTFQLLNIPVDRVTSILVKSLHKLFKGLIVREVNLGEYVKENVPSLKHFVSEDGGKVNQEFSIPSLTALSSALRKLQRYEFKNNHGQWVNTVKPDLGPGLSERIWGAVSSTDENVDDCRLVISELRAALTNLLVNDFCVLAIPTVPGPPPKIATEGGSLETYRSRAFSLLSIAGISGFCQVSIPLGMHDNLPVAVSLLAKHGADGFLLNLVRKIYATLQES
ncbi:amidase 1 [Impatiens glandulifera]|uniref:amidase 1 n=1 Tax=Impatiens glandulifera TaxID=253017 RepID=UPI001FB0C1CB|nr:amidase 1 [Impatiens glandulifera]